MSKVFDFDIEAQNVLYGFLSNIKSTNWKSWLNLSTKEEYEQYLLNNSGFSSFSEILEKDTLDSKSFSIEIDSFLQNYTSSDPIILCHTSGTTNSDISALKWFHMSKDIIGRYWAPGMQAIFESSGLTPEKSAVIFVPSRTNLDGIQSLDDRQYLSLYSSEFSQRTMLSLIKPHSYLFYEYKRSKDLEIISKILSLKDIAVISAPALTILGWADIEKLQKGLSNSIAKNKERFNSISDYNPKDNSTDTDLMNLIKREGVNKVARIIQEKLSEKFRETTIIFSTSSLSEPDWMLIRKFMQWTKGEEKFTNLYVASEVGPIASSLGNFEVSRANSMYLFPLTLSALEYKGKKEIASRTENSIGKLLISRFNNEKILPNIDLGDIIKIKSQRALPIIDGTILRAKFEIKYPLLISKKITLSNHFTIHAGDFFNFDQFEIYNPRQLLNCLNSHCLSNFECLLLSKTNDSTFKLILPRKTNSNCGDLDFLQKTIINCSQLNNLNTAISNGTLNIELINDNPVDFLTTRSKMLNNVRNGKLLKGILKKWALYYIEIN